jgi:hypothetical protein
VIAIGTLLGRGGACKYGKTVALSLKAESDEIQADHYRGNWLGTRHLGASGG